MPGSDHVGYRSSFRNDNALVNGVDAYTLVNLRAGWTDASERFGIDLFLDNVFDTQTFNRDNPATPFLFPVASRSLLGEPRTFGVNLRANF